MKPYIAIVLTFLLVWGTSSAVLSQNESSSSVWKSDAIALYKGDLLLANKATCDLVKISKSGELLAKLQFDDPLSGVVVVGDKAYVTTTKEQGRLHRVDIPSMSLEASVATAMGARSPIVDAQGEYIYVSNQFKGTVSKVSLKDMKVVLEGEAIREPASSVLSKDGKYLFVNNFLPLQPATQDYVGSDVSIFDTKTMQQIKSVKLDNGSNALRGIALSPDGKYVLVSHNLGRFQVPTSQLQQGWMNTSAMSVIDVETLEFVASVLLDEPERGAAGIHGIQCNDENIIISHSGTHDISVIPYVDFAAKLEAYPQKVNLSYDLYFMYGMRTRVDLVGNGPRNFILDGDIAYLPTYFSDTLNIYNVATQENKVVAYNPTRVETREDLGEKYFNDATYCFQNWQSCNGCHPGDARTDGMNWDLMNDGIGNAKNCKSLLVSHVTAPSMISGIRESAELAVRMGYKLIQFTDIPEEKLECVDEYLIALKPLPSPYLVDGELSEKAKAGKVVYDRLDCGSCHSGEYYTDYKMHRIGEDIEFERGWDTPTLVEVWRTAPYLFDGRATTMREVFEVHRHGVEEKLSDKDLDALSEYVLSL